MRSQTYAISSNSDWQSLAGLCVYISGRLHYLGAMNITAWLGLGAGLLLVAACGAPKQAAIPEIEDESGLDTGNDQAGADGGSAEEKTSEGSDASPTADEDAAMHDKCCVNCMEALAKDRSGTAPEEMPCADFTTELSPWCLEHFRDVPTKASECKSAEAPPAAEG